jgi:hypothetical protein
MRLGNKCFIGGVVPAEPIYSGVPITHTLAKQRNALFLNAFETLAEAAEEMKMEKPTQEQLAELRELSKRARVPDESEIVTSRQEAETRIRDLKEKARIE